MSDSSNSFVCGTAFEGSTVVLMARVVDTTNANLTQSDTSSVVVYVYDVTSEDRFSVDSTGAEITLDTAYATPSVSSVVYNALQTDSRWDVDSTGYNVAYKFVPPLKDRLYEVRIKLTTSGGDPLVVGFKIQSK